MRNCLTLICLFTSFYGQAQTDVFVLEKNGASLKTFAAGTEIALETVYKQWFEGSIELIRHDSVFIDGLVFHYKEIAAIRIKRNKINYITDGTLLMAAGVGVLLLGAINGLYRGDPLKSWYTPASYLTAGGLLALGYLIRSSATKTYTLGKKYTLQYLALSADKN